MGDQNTFEYKAFAYNKEIVLTDESGENSAFIRISSNNENTFNRALQNQYKLHINYETVLEENKNIASKTEINSESEAIMEGASVVAMEVVTLNMKDNVTNYTIEKILPKHNTKAVPIYYQARRVGSTICFRALSSTCTISTCSYYTHHDYISGLVSEWHTKKKVINKNKNHIEIVLKVFGVGIVITPETNPATWFLTWNIGDFRGTDCSIGYFDGGNCLVAQAPIGTNPFIWERNFYHSALPGNRCPISGSFFDGAHCFVKSIPTIAEPFIWNNNFYVKTINYMWLN